MLEITNSVLSKEAHAKSGDAIFNFNYMIQNNQVKNITCSISKNIVVNQNTPEGVQSVESPQYVGYIRRENGRLTMDFDISGDLIEYLSAYKQFEKEIDKDYSDDIVTE